MSSLRTYEAMRYVDAIPFTENGEELFYLRDPLELATGPLVMSPLEYYIAALFDGTNTADDIRDYLHKNLQGLSIENQLIDQIYDVLDSQFYINNDGFKQRVLDVKNGFTRADVRPAWHAGGSYPADAEELRQQLESFYLHHEGSGKPGPLNGQSAATEPLIGIMAPHIDLRVGAPIYTHPYRKLVENSEADLFIILGVAHMGAENLFVATKKDFETPLGRIETDREFIDEWSELAGTDLTAGELVHRTEHSVEFQLPFLQHAVKRPFKIVPVLCGSIERMIMEGRRPEAIPQIAAMIDGLKQLVSARGQRAMLVLSVDLAHMGLKFGDNTPITDSHAERIRRRDMSLFDVVSRMDMNAYVDLMQRDLFERKVDACASIYIMMSMMESGRGEFLSYGQNFQPEAQSMVSYGSMAFWGSI